MRDQEGVFLAKEKRKELEAMLQLLNEMTPDEQKEMLVFMMGVKFASSRPKNEVN